MGLINTTALIPNFRNKHTLPAILDNIASGLP